MKKQTNLILALLIGVTLIGCDSLLELNPQASITNDFALVTPANVQSALVGGYAQLGSADTYGGSYIYLSEIYAAPGNEVFFNGTFIDPREVNDKNIITTNAYVARFWTASYNVINRSNNVLSALDIFGTDTATRNRVEAEARFLRGAAYFNLVQLFGKAYNDGNPAVNPGVPINLIPTTTTDEIEQLPRNTVTEVYSQVVADLTAAKDGLGASNGFYANTYVASALLARVHLAMGNFAAAAAESDRVIASDEYALFDDIGDNYSRSENGSETIFAMQVTQTAGANDMAVFHSPTPFGRADIRIETIHLDNYELTDVRRTLFVTTSRGRMTTKYRSTTGDSRRFNINVLRLAEMYLTRAEANFRLTGSLVNGVGNVTPEADINTIRTRAGLLPLPVVTLADILQERRNELMFEGVLFMDMKRNQVGTADRTGAPVAWNADRFTFPVPDRECIVNENLVQNPGYGDC